MGWRDYEKPLTAGKSGCNRDSLPDSDTSTFVSFIPPTQGDGNHDLTFIDHLTEIEREIYEDALEVAQSKFGHDKKTAEGVAGRYVQKYCRPLQAQQAAQDFKRFGYIKIFSSVLGGQVYLVKHKGIAGRVPDRSLPVYTPEDIEAVKGLSPEETLVLLEARFIFNGPLKVEDYTEPPSKRMMDGKAIARNFYGGKQRALSGKTEQEHKE